VHLSIITINLNNSLGLTNTLESVICQHYQDYEYIIIDGGSTDGSVDVIQDHSDKLSYWISEPDHGIYHAMNKGIIKSAGDYLLFLNSGDRLTEPGILSRVAEYFGKADILFGNLINHYEQHGIFKEVRFPDKVTFDYFHTSSLPHPSSFIKRSLFNNYGFYNENLRIASDWEFFVKAIIRNNCSYLHLDFPVSVYNMNGISENPDYRQHMYSEVKNSLNEHFPNFLSDYDELHRLRKEMALMKKKLRLRLKHSIVSNRYIRYILNRFAE
jgi:glycosyltransferase involved in cell wall biosynthesis